MHNRNPMILSLSGGSLMILAGASGAIGINADLVDALIGILGQDAVMTFEIIMGILALLTALGGIGVIISGLILTTNRVRLGRLLLLIFVVMGMLGLLMSLVQLVMSGTIMMGWMLQITQSLGWIGGILALIASTMSEQPRMTAK